VPKRPRLLVASDLHLEFYQDRGRSLLQGLAWDRDASAVILAGDIGVAGKRRATLEVAFQFFSALFPAVFYVPGNHEFYGTRAPQAVDRIRKLVADYPGVTLLEPGVIGRWEDRRVVGSTLWFPFAPGHADISDQMNDFSVIKEFRPWVYEQNAAHVGWLTEVVAEGDIVVTHHLPTQRSVASRFVGNPLNAFFVCDLEKLIEERRPALWVHGHTHDACRYEVGPTMVLSNPFGYPGEIQRFSPSVSWSPAGSGVHR
jgi:predicted phosphodiesterase